MKITFQPIISKEKWYVYARINLALKKQDGVLVQKVKSPDGSNWTNTKDIKKYKSLYISTGIRLEDPLHWNKAKREFYDENRNVQLNNIKTMITDIIGRNKSIIDIHNLGLISDLIKKLVFGKTSKEYKLMIKDSSIIDTNKHFNPDKLKHHEERYKLMPRVEGEIEEVVEQLNEILPVEKNKQLITGMPLYKFIEQTYKNWQKTGIKGFDSARTYKNSMNWVQKFGVSQKRKIRVKDFNQSFVEEFMLWVKQQKKDNGESYSINFISELRKQLQVIDSELKSVHKIITKIDWQGSKSLTKTKEKSIDIALTQEQIKEILNYKIPKLYVDKKGITRPSPKGKYDALALIKLGIFTGMRQSDLNNLNLVEKNGEVYVDQTIQKTGTQVRFLVHPIVKQIWESYNKQLPKLSPQNLGDYFREIGKELGWTYDYNFNRRNPQAGKKVITVSKPLFKMLRTSTLRRTFASMAVNVWNLPLPEVAKVLNHSNIKQTMEYVRVDESQLNTKLKAVYQDF